MNPNEPFMSDPALLASMAAGAAAGALLFKKHRAAAALGGAVLTASTIAVLAINDYGRTGSGQLSSRFP